MEALAENRGDAKFASYDYTDVSPVFFSAAESQFGNLSAKMNFRMLDIEYDPRDQGYEIGTYDLVIAGAVLHATTNLKTTLRHVRSLLKPGGKLVLYEVVENTARIQFAFGLLPGWWRSEEPDRAKGPCVGVEMWDRALRSTGFTGVDADIPDFQDERCHELSILLSTAVLAPHEMPSATPDITIILGEDTAGHRVGAQELKERLQTCAASHCTVIPLAQGAEDQNVGKSMCIFLSDFDRPFLANLSQESFSHLQQVVATARKMLWVSAGQGKAFNPETGMLEGFTRVLRTEYSALQLTTLILDGCIKNQTLGLVLKILEVIMSEGNHLEAEYVVQDGMIHTRRLVDDTSLTTRINACKSQTEPQVQEFGAGVPLVMRIGTPGLLDSLEFIHDTDCHLPLRATDVEIKVRATGINFRDCLTALGQIEEKILGGECAGVITRVGASAARNFKPGDRVIACEVNTFHTLVRTVVDQVTAIPEQMSFAEAASLPITFITAHYSLHKIARLQPGETVLIHLGAGGTGQAAIQIAKSIGATIFTTVGSEKKKQMLVQEYGIPEDHIFYSRNSSFADAVKRKTDGRGVDVVLNSLAGDSMYASWDCIAPYGRFVEIGKRDVLANSKLPMFNFTCNVSFHVFDLSMLMLERPLQAKKSLIQILEMMTDGRLRVSKPLTVYGIGEVETAFRSLQSGNNMGKIVVEMRPNESVKTNLPVSPLCRFDENGSYVIAGGHGGLGRSVARWMASRGAKNLILLSRSGPKTTEALELIEELHNNDVRVETEPCDISSEASLSRMLAHCAETMPPIRGCVQSSMVLRDATFDKMSFDDWKACVSPKVAGSWNLHLLLPFDLDFFLCLSSVTGIIGAGGQANYAAGNTYIDALAQHRIAQGKRASTINLGWMESEGVVAGNEFLEQRLRFLGYFIPVSTEEFHGLLDVHCYVERAGGSDHKAAQSVVGLETPLRMKIKGAEVPKWMTERTFCQMKNDTGLDVSTTENDRQSCASLLQNAGSISECATLVAQGLVEKISKAIGIPARDIDTNKPLYEYGVDSLLAIEVRNWALKECGADVVVFEIMDEVSFLVVGERIAKKSRFCTRLLV